MKEEEFHNYMDFIIMIDYLFTNIDRHMNNIGILRNPNTLELIGFSPIFDNGNSMFYNIPLEELHSIDLRKIKIHSFFGKESKMLTYVKDYNCLDLTKIKPDFSIYEKDIIENQTRYKDIQDLFNRKLLSIKKMQKR